MPQSEKNFSSLDPAIGLIGLAPMEGVVDPLVREMLTALGGIDFCSTEFVRVTDKLLPHHVFYRYAPELNSNCRTSSGVPVFIQLLGGKPDWLAENAHRLSRMGAQGIDLNFGCPAKTVNRHDGGATLLKKPERLFNVITKVKKATDSRTLVTAKVRLGYLDKSLAQEIALACSEAGAHWMTVHGRTKEEAYRPPAHWHVIADMKDSANIPVLANGDITNSTSYQKCQTESKCKSVMIGRGLMTNPFLALELKSPNRETPWLTRLTPLIEYIPRSNIIYGKKRTLGRAKQWLRYLAQGNSKFLRLFNELKREPEIDSLENSLRTIGAIDNSSDSKQAPT